MMTPRLSWWCSRNARTYIPTLVDDAVVRPGLLRIRFMCAVYFLLRFYSRKGKGRDAAARRTIPGIGRFCGDIFSSPGFSFAFWISAE